MNRYRISNKRYRKSILMEKDGKRQSFVWQIDDFKTKLANHKELGWAEVTVANKTQE